MLEDPYAPRDFGVWARTTLLGQSLLDREIPWITFGAARWLDLYLRPSMIVFEWGCGGSTLFLARRTKRVISIEHDPTWARRVGLCLTNVGVTNVDLRTVPPEESKNVETQADLSPYRSSASGYSGMVFRDYAHALRDCSIDNFDLILVDGRVRNACIRSALTRVAAGGVVVVDNSDREDTAEGLRSVPTNGWEVTHFYGPGPSSTWPQFWRTSVLTRLAA